MTRGACEPVGAKNPATRGSMAGQLTCGKPIESHTCQSTHVGISASESAPTSSLTCMEPLWHLEASLWAGTSFHTSGWNPVVSTKCGPGGIDGWTCYTWYPDSS